MQYLNASSAQEALSELIRADGTAIIIAGGTDLMVDMKNGKLTPEILIDITDAEDLKQLEIIDGKLIIGAAVTLSEIASSGLVRKYFPSLAGACRSVGSLQIRNSATLAGNVLTAQPAADGAMALAPLDPVFTVLTKDGTRQMTIDQMYAGFAKSSLDHSRELLTEIAIDLPKSNEAASFQRLELRKSLSLPMLNCAARLSMQDGMIKDVEITMGPVGVGPIRAVAAENFLKGKVPSQELLAEAGKLALENAKPRSNPLRGSKEYRMAALPVMVTRALEACVQQLKQSA
jgi:CO/xanthine dehydrogenase FAD-binding subunit